jgi:transcriptional regulator with XRE-family HTH domain
MFWENYDFLCKRLGKSANKVAEENGYSSGSVTAWKQGRVPKWATIEKFAKYFNVSVDYLLGNEEKPTNESELSEKKRLFIQKIIEMSDNEFEDVQTYSSFRKKQLTDAEKEQFLMKIIQTFGDTTE